MSLGHHCNRRVCRLKDPGVSLGHHCNRRVCRLRGHAEGHPLAYNHRRDSEDLAVWRDRLVKWAGAPYHPVGGALFGLEEMYDAEELLSVLVLVPGCLV
ncbi:hypothetical protein KSB_31310 [Ktedonobacter robiniae]|uniref:Uncharacterized protein n=1 Tax=Ktedonobacter robiniae TaxID=2778365 RepID=A0ABQ3UPK1_9CHLR|nr:hypothetical protein KSB_31310 [Ktedonobacter robiniae]